MLLSISLHNRKTVRIATVSDYRSVQSFSFGSFVGYTVFAEVVWGFEVINALKGELHFITVLSFSYSDGMSKGVNYATSTCTHYFVLLHLYNNHIHLLLSKQTAMNAYPDPTMSPNIFRLEQNVSFNMTVMGSMEEQKQWK